MKHTTGIRIFVILLAIARFSSASANNHEIFRNRATFQTGVSDLTPLVFQGGINVFRGDASNVDSITASNIDSATDFSLTQSLDDSRFFRFATTDLNSIEDLESQIPYGEYQIALTTTGGFDLNARLFDPMPSFTNIPLFTNYEDFDMFDASQPFTVEWEMMSGGNSLAIQIFGPAGFFYIQRPGIGVTSAVIPEGTLQSNHNYTFSLVFANINAVESDGFDGDSVGQVFYQHFTQASFTTLIPEASSLPFLLAFWVFFLRHYRAKA